MTNRRGIECIDSKHTPRSHRELLRDLTNRTCCLWCPLCHRACSTGDSLDAQAVHCDDFQSADMTLPYLTALPVLAGQRESKLRNDALGKEPFASLTRASLTNSKVEYLL